MDILAVIAIALASYRLSHLMVYEDAPLGIARRFRALLRADRPACEGQRMAQQIDNALCCGSCFSLWAVPIVALAWLVFPPLVWWFALSGVVVYAETH